MRENRSTGFTTRFDTNQAVQSQKQAGSSKFQIYEEEEEDLRGRGRLR